MNARKQRLASLPKVLNFSIMDIAIEFPVGVKTIRANHASQLNIVLIKAVEGFSIKVLDQGLVASHKKRGGGFARSIRFFTLRYSAMHKNPWIVFNLDPIRALLPIESSLRKTHLHQAARHGGAIMARKRRDFMSDKDHQKPAEGRASCLWLLLFAILSWVVVIALGYFLLLLLGWLVRLISSR